MVAEDRTHNDQKENFAACEVDYGVEGRRLWAKVVVHVSKNGDFFWFDLSYRGLLGEKMLFFAVVVCF